MTERVLIRWLSLLVGLSIVKKKKRLINRASIHVYYPCCLRAFPEDLTAYTLHPHPCCTHGVEVTE